MYRKLNMIFNNASSLELGIDIIKRYDIPSPKKRIKSISATGRDGNEYEEDGYDDIEITLDFNFISENPHQAFRRCKRWFNCILDNKLIFSDNPNIFYRVNYAVVTESTRDVGIEFFTVTLNCEPFAYEMEGQKEILINNAAVIYNAGDLESKPIIKIQGEGLVTIKINEDTIKANIGQEIIIDSYLGLSYKTDKTPQNNNIKGRHPRLKLGENTISYSGGRVDSFIIIPNWTIY